MHQQEEYAALIEPVARFFFGEPNRALSSKNELRFGNRGSLAIDLKKGVWYDHETGQGGGVCDMVVREAHCEMSETGNWLHEHGYHLPDDDEPSKHNGKGGHQQRKIIAIYSYTDKNENLLSEVVRFDPKDFRQRRPDGNGGHIWSVRGVPNVPYRLHELDEAIDLEHPIYVVEGEKCVDILRERFRVVASCNAGGAGKWRDELSEFFKDADVVVIPDNDPQKKNPKTGELMFHEGGRPVRPGQDHAHDVARSLQGVARRVRYLNLAKHWPGMPLKGDVYDWITRGGGTREMLDALAEQAPEWSSAVMELDFEQQPLIEIRRPFPIIEYDIPPRAWTIPLLLSRKHVTVIVAPSGAGKSLLTLQLGIHSALKKPWADWRPRKKFRVLFINSEDDYDEMRRRLAAACRVEGLTESDQQRLHENFMIAADVEADDLIEKKQIDSNEIRNGAVIAEVDPRKKTMIVTPRFRELINIIKTNRIDIIFVDPFAETFIGDENSNSELKMVGALWREIARRTNTAICLVHHTKKYATGMAGDVDAARGAGALIGIARIVSTLFPMTPKEAEVMLTEEDEPTKDGRGNPVDIYAKRTHYLRYDDAKANLSVISAHAKWFLKKTIRLDNACEEDDDGEKISIPGDEVGVLIPWKAKGPDLLEEQILNFFRAVDRGLVMDGKTEFYTFNSKGGSERYIGAFAKEFLKTSLKQAEDWIKKWRKGGRLEEIEYLSPNQRKKAVRRVVSELSPDAPRNKKTTENDENGEFNFQHEEAAQIIPFKQRQDGQASVPFMITIAMKDNLYARGFSDDEIFNMTPARAREILADPKHTAFSERYKIGEDAAEQCLVCQKGGAKWISGRTSRGQYQTRALHPKCAPNWFQSSDLPVDDS